MQRKLLEVLRQRSSAGYPPQLASGVVSLVEMAHFQEIPGLEDSVDAMKMLEERQVVGKVVVTANGYSPSTSD